MLRNWILAGLMLNSASVMAWEYDGNIGIESRFFFEKGSDGQERFHPSLSTTLGMEHAFEETDLIFESELFLRGDLEDAERSHGDISELSFLYFADEWEIKAGISKVFWGVVESTNLVDIINQTDLVENIDGEDKLGQPMIHFSAEKDWGTLELFLLPGHRERTSAGRDGRLARRIDLDYDVVYVSGAEDHRGDAAIRFSHYIGDLEFSISHFSGTSRDPLVRLGGTLGNLRLEHVYPVIDQTGVEAQYVTGSWLFKHESISRSGYGPRYYASVSGFEYTQVGVFDSQYDMGWILEYLFDDRDENAPSIYENDLFGGLRFVFNDADSSEILTGVLYDTLYDQMAISFEMSQRLSEDFKVVVEGRIFHFDEPRLDDEPGVFKADFLRDEDYVSAELIYYF